MGCSGLQTESQECETSERVFPSLLDTFSVCPSLEGGQCVHYGRRAIGFGMGYRVTRAPANTVMISDAKPSFRLVLSLLTLHVHLVVAAHDFCV